MTPEQLAASEDIRAVKARYCHFVDRKRWTDLGSIFTADAELHKISGGVTSVIRGRDEIVRTLSTNLADTPTLHYATNPIITFSSEHAAEGTWCALYMNGTDGSTGHGWYDERYVCRDGRWLIAQLVLTVNFMR